MLSLEFSYAESLQLIQMLAIRDSKSAADESAVLQERHILNLIADKVAEKLGE